MRAARAAGPAASISYGRSDEGLGLAHTVRDRRLAGNHSAHDAAQLARDRRIHRSE